MTHDQIVNLLISLGSGTLLLIAAKALGPLFKRISERMNRPSPLTPQSKGQLVTAIAQSETELERLRYLNTHPRDLFLALIQLLMATFMFALAAALLYLLPVAFVMSAQSTAFAHLMGLFMVIAALVISITGMVQAGRLSEKKIDKILKGIEKTIEDYTARLNPPVG